MLKKHLQFSFAFAFIFIVQLLSLTDEHTSKLIFADFHYIIKPSITISLMMYLAAQTRFSGRFNKRIFIGLFFGLAGDTFLMFVDVEPNFFIFGLAAFLIGHLLYISAFFIDYKWRPAIEKTTMWVALIVFGLSCLSFYMYLRPYLGEMKIPVMIYAFVISLMAIMATNRRGRVNTFSFKIIFLGAILFLISDAILAYNKFVHHMPHASFAIMFTYMSAQFLITIGAIERKLKKQLPAGEH